MFIIGQNIKRLHVIDSHKNEIKTKKYKFLPVSDIDTE